MFSNVVAGDFTVSRVVVDGCILVGAALQVAPLVTLSYRRQHMTISESANRLATQTHSEHFARLSLLP